MTINNQQNLLCPFCGNEVIVSQYLDESLWSHEQVVWHRIYCYVCDIGMSECCDNHPEVLDSFVYYEKLVERWNNLSTNF